MLPLIVVVPVLVMPVADSTAKELVVPSGTAATVASAVPDATNSTAKEIVAAETADKPTVRPVRLLTNTCFAGFIFPPLWV